MDSSKTVRSIDDMFSSFVRDYFYVEMVQSIQSWSLNGAVVNSAGSRSSAVKISRHDFGISIVRYIRWNHHHRAPSVPDQAPSVFS